jgi:hypothetical protein
MTTRFGTRGRSLAVAIAVCAALTVAGCGNQKLGPGYADGSAGGPTYAAKALGADELMPAAYAAASKARTAHITMAVTRKTRTGETCSCMQAEGDVVYGAHRPAMSLSMTMPGMGRSKIMMRFVGGMIYARIPRLTPPGKFVAVDPKDRTSPLARGFADGAGQMDPLKSIKTMQSAVQSAERVGKQTMGGVTVEHYKLTIDTSSLAKQLDPAAAKLAKLPDTVTYDLWLDEQHRMRRTSFEMAGMTFETTMSRWGQPVRVERPAANAIVSMSPGLDS